MGLFEKNWDDLTGKSIILDDIEFTWDEDEELPPDEEADEEFDEGSADDSDEEPQEGPQTQKEENKAAPQSK
ncbi:hypothetical protein SDC9_179201 [bioreactor metagenome]|uniref:Uncharacterized protein n=1 Tax=bioreactor metagenome TaxID=1076179 RepID=A0A645GYB5_9ZZZZ